MGRWLCSLVAFLLVLAGCGSDNTPTRTNDFTPLTSITIVADLDLNTLAQGTSTQLVAIGNYSGLFTKDITSQVTWSSDQPSIADPDFFLSHHGRVKAQVAGVATITATTSDGITGSFNLTVTAADIVAVTVTSAATTLPVGLTQAFTAQGTFSDATTQDLTFDATWSSSEIFATVSNDLNSKGVVTGGSKGMTNISAEFNGISGLKPLEVTDPILLAIEINSANSSLLSLSSQPFFATGKYSDNSSPDVTANVTWDSSNKDVAAFGNGSNIIKTLTSGTTTINATLGTVRGTSNLKVTGGNLTSITLTLNQAVNNVLINGTLSRVKARGAFSNDTSRDITGAMALTVDNSANATVTPVSGNLAWVQALTSSATPVKISATYGTLTGQSFLTITAPILNDGGLSILPATLDLSKGTSGRLSLAGSFPSGSSQDLTPTAEWSSAVPATATVGLDKGRVTALAPGTSVITATYGGQVATSTVTVTNRTLVSLTISAVSTPTTIVAGTEIPYKVTALYSDGFTQDVTADATWTIDKQNVGKFSDEQVDPGLVVAVDAGTAMLTAVFDGRQDTETLVVSP